MTKSIGIIGGSFNPIHMGHLLLAEAAKEAKTLEKIIFMPTAVPPHKPNQRLASGQDRVAMIEASISGIPGYECSTLEIDSGGISYTIDTVKKIRQQAENEINLYFVVGADSVREIHTWYQYEKLCAQVTFLAGARPGIEIKPDDPTVRKATEMIESVVCGISSSEIRDRISQSRSIRFMVPKAVEEIIIKRGLYQSE
jgi:nicotinate-nucleotide adenylyltransferase